MSLDNINMNEVLIAQLFKNSLIDNAGTVSTNNEPKKQGDIPFLGKNEKGIIILVNCEEAPYLPDAHLSFLIKMLEACKLTLADVAIINICGNVKVTYDTIIRELSPIQIIFFEVDPVAIGFPLKFPQFKIQEYNDMKLLTAPSLGTIESNLKNKNLLWTALKNIFDLN